MCVSYGEGSLGVVSHDLGALNSHKEMAIFFLALQRPVLVTFSL